MVREVVCHVDIHYWRRHHTWYVVSFDQRIADRRRHTISSNSRVSLPFSHATFWVRGFLRYAQTKYISEETFESQSLLRALLLLLLSTERRSYRLKEYIILYYSLECNLTSSVCILETNKDKVCRYFLWALSVLVLGTRNRWAGWRRRRGGLLIRLIDLVRCFSFSRLWIPWCKFFGCDPLASTIPNGRCLFIGIGTRSYIFGTLVTGHSPSIRMSQLPGSPRLGCIGGLDGSFAFYPCHIVSINCNPISLSPYGKSPFLCIHGLDATSRWWWWCFQ